MRFCAKKIVQNQNFVSFATFAKNISGFSQIAQKKRKTHCVLCAKIAQKFAKKIYAKIAQILRKRFSHFVETLLWHQTYWALNQAWVLVFFRHFFNVCNLYQICNISNFYELGSHLTLQYQTFLRIVRFFDFAISDLFTNCAVL